MSDTGWWEFFTLVWRRSGWLAALDFVLTTAVVWWHDHVLLPLGRWLRGRR